MINQKKKSLVSVIIEKYKTPYANDHLQIDEQIYLKYTVRTVLEF